MKSETFYEVLRSQVRDDLERELRSEIIARRERDLSPQRRAATCQHEYLGTWLATHLSARLTPPWPQAYRPPSGMASAKASESPEALKPIAEPEQSRKAELKYHASSTDELAAYQILQTVLRECGTSLSATFTMPELKRGWKTAALKIHPDRHPSATAREVAHLNERFTALLNAVNVLLQCKHL